MKLNPLKEEIESTAKKQEAELLEKARAEAKRIEEEAEAKANELMGKAAEEGKSIAAEQSAELLAAARLLAKKRIAAAREIAVQKAVNRMQEMVAAKYAKGSEYKRLLLKMASAAAHELGDGSVVLCRKEDQKTLEAAGFKVAKNINCLGGAIVQSADGRVQINNTLEFLIELHRDELKHTAFTELFKGMEFNLSEKTPSKTENKTKGTSRGKLRKRNPPKSGSKGKRRA